MLNRKRFGLAAGAILLCTSLVAADAAASASVTSGNAHCLVTARAPRLEPTGLLSGSAIVQCDITAIVSVEIRVVEMDGATIDPTVVIPRITRAITVSPGKSSVISTGKVTCVDTEPGNEEFSTRSRITLLGLQSAADFTQPLNDSYAC